MATSPWFYRDRRVYRQAFPRSRDARAAVMLSLQQGEQLKRDVGPAPKTQGARKAEPVHRDLRVAASAEHLSPASAARHRCGSLVASDRP